jgi:hypothetical protein
MKKLAAIAVMAGLAVNSFALFDLVVLSPDKVATLPSSGSITLTWAGSITCSDNWVIFGAPDMSLMHQLNSNVALPFPVIAPSLTAFLTSNGYGDDYSGDLFSVTIDASQAPGYYAYVLNSNDAARITANGQDVNFGGFADSEAVSAQLNPVPEPATLLVLGLGAAAVLKRRRR